MRQRPRVAEHRGEYSTRCDRRAGRLVKWRAFSSTEGKQLRPYEELGGPPGLPLVGNLFQIRLDTVHRQFEHWADRYGPLYRFRVGPYRTAVVSDAPTIRWMHRERPHRFRRTRAIELVMKEMRIRGVFAAEGEDWLRQRKLVVMALNTAHLRACFPKLRVIVGRLARRWEQAADTQEPVDLGRELMRLTVDVTTQLAFGLDFNTLETDGPVIQRNLDRVFPMLHRRTTLPFPYWRYVRLPRDRALDRALDELEGQVEEIIRAVYERMRADRSLYTSPTNFLEAIIAAKEERGVGFSNADIFANVCTLLLAGEDTTANTITWAMHYFMRYPEHFARARAEVDEVVPAGTLPEEKEQVERLPFIDAFFNEAMRLKPVAPLGALEPLEDVDLLGYRIPKGMEVTTLNRHIAMQDEHFGDAARFDPERWLADGAERGRPHDTDAFIPFGSGPRFCPGRNLAVLQIRMTLAMLCRNFDLVAARPDRPVEEKFAFTMMPARLVVRIRRRAPRRRAA